jgi:hypothetical protein
MKDQTKCVVFVVITEWGGPGYKNPGDAEEFTVEGVALTAEAADRIKEAAIAQNVEWGHEMWNGENSDTWAFDMHVEEHPVDGSFKVQP